MSTSDIDLTEIKEFLVGIAQVAGKLIKEKSGKVSFDDKKNGKYRAYPYDKKAIIDEC